MEHDTAISIDLASTRDAARIALMSRDLIESGLGWSWRAGRVARQIARRDATVLVARDQHGVCGFAVMRLLDEYARLDLLAVAPSRQRAGIGSRLLQWLEDGARTAGAGLVHLEVRETNAPARAFYRAVGYLELVRIPGYYGGRESAVRMYHDLRVTGR